MSEIGDLQTWMFQKLTQIKDGKYVATNAVYPFKKTDKISVLEIFSAFQPIFHAKRQITGISFREIEGHMEVQLNSHP